MCPGLEVERPWRLGFPLPHWTGSDTFVTGDLKALTGSVVSLAQSLTTGEHLAGPPILCDCSALEGFCVWKATRAALHGRALRSMPGFVPLLARNPGSGRRPRSAPGSTDE
jgi:hypothetical protein